MKKRFFYMFLAAVMTFTSLPVNAEIVEVNDDIAVLSEDEVVFEGSEEEYQDSDEETETDKNLNESEDLEDAIIADEDEVLLDTASEECISPEYTGNVTASPTQSKYDPREYGLTSSIRNQSGNLCWLYATMSAAESNLIKKGLTDNTIDLSELQVVWFMHRAFTDPLGNYTEDVTGDGTSNQNILLYGGLNREAIDALSRWSGPVLEEEAPLNRADYIDPNTGNITQRSANKITVDESLATKSLWHFKGAKFCQDVSSYYSKESQRECIKKLISEYGGVAMAFYQNAKWFYAEENGADANYYSNDGKREAPANHEVEIVGWDDNYSRDNFKGYYQGTPSMDGAWLIKDSSGEFLAGKYGSTSTGATTYRTSGFFWMSYEYPIEDIAAVDFESADAHENLYCYDGEAFKYGANFVRNTDMIRSPKVGL